MILKNKKKKSYHEVTLTKKDSGYTVSVLDPEKGLMGYYNVHAFTSKEEALKKVRELIK